MTDSKATAIAPNNTQIIHSCIKIINKPFFPIVSKSVSFVACVLLFSSNIKSCILVQLLKKNQIPRVCLKLTSNNIQMGHITHDKLLEMFE